MGISVAVFSPDCGESYFNYRVQNQTADKVAEDILFALNSTTKVFTSVSLSYLRIKKKFDLTDRVQQFMTDHRMPIDSNSAYHEITF